MLRNIKDFSTLSTVYEVVPFDKPATAVKPNGWTPGPWWVVATDTETYVRERGGLIASGTRPSMYDRQYDRFVTELTQYKANAYLIAAAPDLYEALDKVVRFDQGEHHLADGDYVNLIDMARSALAKARGE